MSGFVDWLYKKRVIILMERFYEVFGVEPETNAAVAGNASYESARFTELHEGGQPADRGGIGICMWTGREPPNDRRAKYENFCRARSLDALTFNAGVEFLIYELQHDYAGALRATRVAVGLSNKTAAFEQRYEGAGIVREGQRLAHAEACLAVWNAQPKDPAVPGAR